MTNRENAGALTPPQHRDQGLPPQLPQELRTPVPAPLGPLELELAVPACGNLGLAGRQLWLGRRHAGQQIQLWIDHQVIHLSTDGRPMRAVGSL